MKLPQLLLIFEVLLLYLALILQHLGASWLRLLLVLGVSAVLRDEEAPGWREHRDQEGSERCSCAVRAGDGAPRPEAARTEPCTARDRSVWGMRLKAAPLR